MEFKCITVLDLDIKNLAQDYKDWKNEFNSIEEYVDDLLSSEYENIYYCNNINEVKIQIVKSIQNYLSGIKL